LDDDAPVWPREAVYAAADWTEAERAIVPRAWWARASDGYRLGVLSWAGASRPRGDLVILHGVQSHAGWYHGLGRRLAAAGLNAHFPDRRGSGANSPARGHAASARRLVDDVVEVLAAIPRTGGPLVLGGISWGGKLAVVAAARNPRTVDGLALICPGLHPRVGVRAREKLGVAAALLTGQAARPVFPIPLADPALFTDNSAARRFIANDPLSLRLGTAGLLFASRMLDRQVSRARRRVRCPALLMLAGRDRIVDNRSTRAYFEGLGSERKTVIEYPEAHHTLDFEPDPGRYVRDLVGWIDAACVP